MKKIGMIALAIIGLILMSGTASALVIEHKEAEDINSKFLNRFWGRKVSDITESTSAYGGILKDGDARMVTDVESDNPAIYIFRWNSKGIPQNIKIRHLDGIADDSFTVYILGIRGWVKIGKYADSFDSETWVESDFSLEKYISKRSIIPKFYQYCIRPKRLIIKIALEDEDHSTWSNWQTYGQLAIDWLELTN